MAAHFDIAATVQLRRDDALALLREHGQDGFAARAVGCLVVVDDAAGPEQQSPKAGLIVGFVEQPQQNPAPAADVARNIAASTEVAVTVDGESVLALELTLVVEFGDERRCVAAAAVSNDALSAALYHALVTRTTAGAQPSPDARLLAPEAVALARRRIDRSDSAVATLRTVPVSALAPLLPPSSHPPPAPLVAQLLAQRDELRAGLAERSRRIQRLLEEKDAAAAEARAEATASAAQLTAKVKQQAEQLQATQAERDAKAADAEKLRQAVALQTQKVEALKAVLRGRLEAGGVPTTELRTLDSFAAALEAVDFVPMPMAERMAEPALVPDTSLERLLVLRQLPPFYHLQPHPPSREVQQRYWDLWLRGCCLRSLSSSTAGAAQGVSRVAAVVAPDSAAFASPTLRRALPPAAAREVLAGLVEAHAALPLPGAAGDPMAFCVFPAGGCHAAADALRRYADAAALPAPGGGRACVATLHELQEELAVSTHAAPLPPAPSGAAFDELPGDAIARCCPAATEEQVLRALLASDDCRTAAGATLLRLDPDAEVGPLGFDGVKFTVA